MACPLASQQGVAQRLGRKQLCNAPILPVVRPVQLPTTRSAPLSNVSQRQQPQRSIQCAVAAPAPEMLLEKGGPGAKYEDGVVEKVRITILI